MEYYWTLFNNSNGSNSNSVRGHNGNCSSNNHAWESWDLGSSGGTSRVDWTYPLHNSLNYTPSTAGTAASSARQVEASAFHALMLHEQEKIASRHSSSSTTTSSSLFVGKEPQYYNADPHLTCLKLGKRHYFEDVTIPLLGERHVAAAGPSSLTKKGKPYYSTPGGPSAPPVAVADATPAVVPRCQVEGCEAVLVNAKDYHRRHKVCEMHAKAPKVVVLGIEQRFCQQCSRFHALAEFDESKRSCRRRLAGHNERRRKSSQEQHSLARKHSQDIKMMAAGRHPHFVNSSECALSLLSSTNYSPWNISTSSADLPARCSAALRELIAENRASILACRQLTNSNQIEDYDTYKLGSIRAGSNPQESGGHVTLDLMQAPNSAFGLLSVHDHKSSKEGDEEDCSELWKVPLGY
ncbi:hypothetical protein Pfo_001412 [Paulownia fortunei]|nr:hypothetical protein Pfo_001412 [Paulownia fortunei]